MTKEDQEIRVYTKPIMVTFCLNCPSAHFIKENRTFRCMEYPYELKEIDSKVLLSDDNEKPFPDFCPLTKTNREQFEKNRGW